MRIVSYNVNGIRAAMRKGLLEWITEDNADVYCFQEIKANLADIPVTDFENIGYKSHWFPAQKKGYSGVGILYKEPIDEVIFGMNNKQADMEGRTIQANLNNFKLVNTYFPSGSSGDERQAYKMEFLDEYLHFSQTLRAQTENIIIVGDYNICHKPIDIHDPIRNKNSSGFLPEEREWMDLFFDSGFVDTFRLINPQPHQYTWWSYRANARANNKGWRIDYISVSEKMMDRVQDAGILADVMHSDHCPIFVEIS